MDSFWHTLADNGGLFGRAFLTTVELFGVSALGATVLGTVLATCRVSPVPALRAVGTAYVNTVRNTPLTLVFAFLVFAVPKLDVTLGASYFPSACVALTLYTAAFVCETVRAGVNTVPAGQAEAARAIGLSFGQSLRFVVLPQAFRATVPPLISVLIALLKNTTIAAGFSVLEAGAIPAYLAERGENRIFTLLWITLFFLVLIVPLAGAQRFAERKWAIQR